MSDHVVHFTKDYNGAKAFNNWLSILQSQTIEARSLFGLAKERAPDQNSQKAVCFTEIPITHLKRIAKHRSSYGIAFRKPNVVHRGANPILYAYKDHALAGSVWAMIDAAKDNDEKDAPIWKIAPFVDAPGTYLHGAYLFEWEREWRHIGDFTFFPEEVEFLIVPEIHHANLIKIFAEMKRIGHKSPSYDAPMIDPLWKRKRIKEILSEAAA